MNIKESKVSDEDISGINISAVPKATQNATKYTPYSKMANTRNDLGLITWRRGLVGQTSKSGKF